MSDLISRQAAINALRNYLVGKNVPCDGTLTCRLIENEVISKLPSAHEPLTDKEQRIFLAAMERERKICKEVDDQYTHEPYKVLLTKVCSEIERKVKVALWS